MADKEKETIIIPRAKEFFKKTKESLEGKNPYVFYFVLIFVLFAVLLVLITYLPMDHSLKVISLIIGSFVLIDIHHSLKSLCLKNQN